MGIIVFIIILAVLVLIHEFGHFLMAKKNGVKVEEFGFGFPPRIWGIKKGETLYSINWIPLGGFVKMYGEEYQETTDKKNFEKDRTFVYKKPWQKALIVVAGVIGNFLLGWVLISYLFTQGVSVPTNMVTVEQVQKKSPAATAGIKNQDEIYRLQADNKTYDITSPDDIIGLTKKYAGQKITLFVDRNKVKKQISIVPRINPPKGAGALGISIIAAYNIKKYVWYKAPFYGLTESVNLTKTIVTELLKTLIGLITLHKPSVDVTGPIGIANYTNQALKYGTNAVLELMALLSLNLAIVNILPFPALDGGRFVFVIYEWVTKKRVNQKVEQYTNLVGFFVLISLAILISINDIIKLLK